MGRVVSCYVSAAVTAGGWTSRERDKDQMCRFHQDGTSGLARCFFSTNLHKKLFLAVFGLKLDLEAAGRDLARVLPVLQVVLVLFLSI